MLLEVPSVKLSRVSFCTYTIIAGLIYFILFGSNPAQAQSQVIMATKASMENLNGKLLCVTVSLLSPNSFCMRRLTPCIPVLKKPLALFSKQPLTGFYRDGYCRVGPEDHGNHAVAGVVTKEFLEYSASKGNDLRQIGLTDGCKWCLCTTRWKEAFDGWKNGEVSEKGVPKVFLHATDQSALEKVPMDDLKKFAAQGEASNAEKIPATPSSRPSAAIKEV
jgi:uncharacterized protein